MRHEEDYVKTYVRILSICTLVPLAFIDIYHTFSSYEKGERRKNTIYERGGKVKALDAEVFRATCEDGHRLKFSVLDEEWFVETPGIE